MDASLAVLYVRDASVARISGLTKAFVDRSSGSWLNVLQQSEALWRSLTRRPAVIAARPPGGRSESGCRCACVGPRPRPAADRWSARPCSPWRRPTLGWTPTKHLHKQQIQHMWRVMCRFTQSLWTTFTSAGEIKYNTKALATFEGTIKKARFQGSF